MEEEKLRNAGAGEETVFLKLSGVLMCLCPAESKEIENISAVPGVCRETHAGETNREGREMECKDDVKRESGISM